MSERQLRKRLIRLASRRPEFRGDLLPLLVGGSASVRSASVKWTGVDREVRQTQQEIQKLCRNLSKDLRGLADWYRGEYGGDEWKYISQLADALYTFVPDHFPLQRWEDIVRMLEAL